LDVSDHTEICKKRIDELVKIYSKVQSVMERKEAEKNISNWKRVCK